MLFTCCCIHSPPQPTHPQNTKTLSFVKNIWKSRPPLNNSSRDFTWLCPAFMMFCVQPKVSDFFFLSPPSDDHNSCQQRGQLSRPWPTSPQSVTLQHCTARRSKQRGQSHSVQKYRSAFVSVEAGLNLVAGKPKCKQNEPLRDFCFANVYVS